MEKIFGCSFSGQVGAYFARLLLDNGSKAIDTSRDAHMGAFAKL